MIDSALRIGSCAFVYLAQSDSGQILGSTDFCFTTAVVHCV